MNNNHPSRLVKMVLCLATALTVIPEIGFSQLSEVIIPREAIRLRPPENAKWSIRIDAIEKESEQKPDDESIPDDAGNEEQGREISRAEYTLTGKTGRAIMRSANGKREEIYFFKEGGDTLFLRYLEKARRVVPYKLDAYLTQEFRFSQTYPGVDWVRQEDYDSVVEFRGEACHLFILEPQKDNRTEETEASIAYNPRFSQESRRAWFSAKTGLPVAFQTEGAKGTFRHEKPPSSPIKLSKPYLDALQYYYGYGKRPEPHDAPQSD